MSGHLNAFDRHLTDKLIDELFAYLMKYMPWLKYLPPLKWLLKILASRIVTWCMSQAAMKATLAHVTIEISREGREYKKQLEKGDEEKIKQSFHNLVSFRQ